jgi:hypothetical protein
MLRNDDCHCDEDGKDAYDDGTNIRLTHLQAIQMLAVP